MKNTQPQQTGFTLIELVIVVAIVALLAAIAIPNYQRYVLESARTDATRSLLECAAALERRFTLNNDYPLTVDPDNVCSVASRDQYYTITVTNPGRAGVVCVSPAGNNSCYLITATIAANRFGNPNQQLGDQPQCTTFSLDDRGVKAATGNQSQAILGVGRGRCWRS